jgi:hypothetical protein
VYCACKRNAYNILVEIPEEGKGKVKLSLCFFNRAPLHEGVLGWRYSSTHSLKSALDGGE